MTAAPMEKASMTEAAPERPTILMPDYGWHNSHLTEELTRLDKVGAYRDLSTVIVTPVRSHAHGISAKVVQSWLVLMKPMNQAIVGPLFITGKEVGAAYETAIQLILGNPQLSKYTYMLTLEDDIIPQPNALSLLYESIEGGVDGHKYDVMQALYWVKGMEGQPMIYGDPLDIPRNYRPQRPKPDTVQPACGLGMGFNLFRLSLFKDPKLPRPFFQTTSNWDHHIGAAMFTQDLNFYQAAGLLGYKFAVDTRARCGHYSAQEDLVW